MKLLLDTHLLLWAAAGDAPRALKTLLLDVESTPVFSAASIWEVAIKTGLGRPDFSVDAGLLRRGLLDNGYLELAVESAHTAAVARLPPLHKDPFDRMLIAQASVEGIVLLTADAVVAGYPGPIQKI